MSEPCRFQVSTSGSFAVDRVCAVHDAECAPICDTGLDALRAKLEAITAWSPVSGRPCPLCTYQEGKFLASCAWHRETGEQARVIAELQQPAIIPVCQTTFGEGKDGNAPGNCFAASIATIVGKPITEVPNFIIESEWVTAAQSWLASHGWGLVQMPWPETVYRGQFPEAYVVVSGWGFRGLRHSVVGKVVRRDDGYPHVELVHDPHPDGGGLDTKRGEQYVTFLFRINTQALSPKEA